MTMKRFLLHIIYITALLPFLASCSQSEDVPTDASGNDHVQLSLSVTARALPQEGKEIGTGEPDNMHLWVFGLKNNGNKPSDNDYTLLSYRDIKSPSFTGSDAFGNPVHTITDLDIPDGKKYKKMYFYVVLNSGSVKGLENLNVEDLENQNKITKISELQALTFTGIVSGKDDNQMLMYGVSDPLEINPHKTNYETNIDVTRAVAKLELHFTKKESTSTLNIKKVTLSSVIGKGYLVPTPLLNDNTIYKQSATNVELFNGSETIDKALEEEDLYGNFSEYETTNFKELALSAPYLMENPYGLDWTDNQTDEKYPETDSSADVSKYYQLTVDYVIDGSADTEKFYLPKIERNHLYKIYVRARSTNIELNWEVVPFDQVTNDIPIFN